MEEAYIQYKEEEVDVEEEGGGSQRWTWRRHTDER